MQFFRPPLASAEYITLVIYYADAGYVHDIRPSGTIRRNADFIFLSFCLSLSVSVSVSVSVSLSRSLSLSLTRSLINRSSTVGGRRSSHSAIVTLQKQPKRLEEINPEVSP